MYIFDELTPFGATELLSEQICMEAEHNWNKAGKSSRSQMGGSNGNKLLLPSAPPPFF